MAEFAHGQAVAHRHRAGADEALPAVAQGQAFNRPAGRVGAVEHPDRLAVLGRRFEHVAQRGDEGVDAAAEVLQVDEQDVEGFHHRGGRPAHFAVEAEDGNAELRVEEIRRFDHVVLLVAAQAVLRAEGGGQLEVGQGGEGVERMRQVGRHRSRVGEQGDAAAGQRAAQGGVGEQAVDAELNGTGHGVGLCSVSEKLWRRWKSGWAAQWLSAQ